MNEKILKGIIIAFIPLVATPPHPQPPAPRIRRQSEGSSDETKEVILGNFNWTFIFKRSARNEFHFPPLRVTKEATKISHDPPEIVGSYMDSFGIDWGRFVFIIVFLRNFLELLRQNGVKNKYF